MIHLLASKKTEIAQQIRREINASDQAKGSIIDVWNDIVLMQRGCRNDQTVQIIQGMPGYDFPLYRDRRGRIVAQTYSTVTNLSPYVQAMDPTQGNVNVDYVEKDLMGLAKISKWAAAYKRALGWAVDVNLGTIRITPDTDEDGNVVGVNSESISPMHMVCWPPGLGEYEKMKTIGHCYYELNARVREKCASREYDCDPNDILGGASPSETQLPRESNDRFLIDGTQLDPFDGLVRMYDIVTELDLGDGDQDEDGVAAPNRKKYAVIYDYSDDKVLWIDRCSAKINGKEVDYPCWYVAFNAISGSEEGVWPTDSVARPVLGLQDAYNRNMNTMQQGNAFAAFGVHIIFGGDMPIKFLTFKPGAMIPVADGLKVQSLTFTFNFQGYVVVNEIIKELFDGLMGITQLGNGQNVAASTSASAVNALQQSQNESKDAYIDQIAPSVAKCWELYWFILRAHYGSLKKALPSVVTTPNWDLIKDLHLEFEVTGTSSASNPQSVLQKLQAFLQVIGSPIQLPPKSPFDVNKIFQAVLEWLDLPFSPEKLMVTIPGLTDNMAELVQDLQNAGYPAEQIKEAMGELKLLMREQALAQSQQQGMPSLGGGQPQQPSQTQAPGPSQVPTAVAQPSSAGPVAGQAPSAASVVGVPQEPPSQAPGQ